MGLLPAGTYGEGIRPQMPTHTKGPAPLFVVGMPRSGTKLLRALLNRHPEVDLCPNETHFIPYMLSRYGPPSTGEWARDVYRDLCATPFYGLMKQVGRELSWPQWNALVESSDGQWATLLEGVLRFYGEKGLPNAKVWGDKTPGYLRHIPLLKKTFPGARFVHILRDPRDYCLSVRRAWGKSILRAADRWQSDVAAARFDGQGAGQDYTEIKYEELVGDPKVVLNHTCDFLGITYSDGMLDLTAPVENLGRARDHVGILGSNFGQFRQQLSAKEIQQVEQIAYRQMLAVGYQPEQADRHVPLSPIGRRFMAAYDGWASVTFHLRDKGFVPGLTYAYRHYTRSSWRQWPDHAE
jgi:hypothetical protein